MQYSLHWLKKRIFIVALLVACAGCSFFTSEEETQPVTQEPNTPFSLNMLDEVFNGDELFLRLKLKVLAVWDPAWVSVRVAILKNGEVQDVKTFPLKDLIEKDLIDNGALLPGEYPVIVNIPNKDATDYQVELVWKVDEELNSGDLEILHVSGEQISGDCQAGDPECKQVLEVTCVLHNKGQATITAAILEVAFKDDAADDDGLIYSQEVNLDDLELESGQEQALQFEVDISETPAVMKFEPVVKVVSYQ